MSDFWTNHYFRIPLNKADDWDSYLFDVEQILGDRLTRLDDNDPLRRKIDSVCGQGDYITAFNPKYPDMQKIIFGRFERTKILLEITLYPTVQTKPKSSDNSIGFSIPIRQKQPLHPDTAIRLFNRTAEFSSPYYAYADLKEAPCSRKSSGGGAVSSEIELLGVFWLTFFGPHYKTFFGERRLRQTGAQFISGPLDGVTLRLAPHYDEVTLEMRKVAENALSPLSFAAMERPTELGIKKRGQYVLTYDRLLRDLGEVTPIQDL